MTDIDALNQNLKKLPAELVSFEALSSVEKAKRLIEDVLAELEL